jgi:DNA-binding transcriptional LysR family regulator
MEEVDAVDAGNGVPSEGPAPHGISDPNGNAVVRREVAGAGLEEPGATARSLDEWRESVASGLGISLCPASAERWYARPGLAFVPAVGVPPAPLAVAWRTGGLGEEVRRFLDLLAQYDAPVTSA